MKTVNQETVEEKIKQEKTKDLGNIHNFLTSVVKGKDGNLSCFALLMQLQIELENRAKSDDKVKLYLNCMDKLFGVDKIEGMKPR